MMMACHSEGRSKPVLSEAEGKNLVFGKQAFCYAKNEILRLHYVPAQNDNTSIQTLTEY
jgi:hypothetical protein